MGDRYRRYPSNRQRVGHSPVGPTFPIMHDHDTLAGLSTETAPRHIYRPDGGKGVVLYSS